MYQGTWCQSATANMNTTAVLIKEKIRKKEVKK